MSRSTTLQPAANVFDATYLEVLHKSKQRLTPSTSDEWTIISVLAHRARTVHTHGDGGLEHQEVTATRLHQGVQLDDGIYLVDRGAIVRVKPKSDWLGRKKDQPTGDYIEAAKLTGGQRTSAIKVIEKLNAAYVRSEEARRARLLS